MDLELFIKLFNLANEDELHTFELFDVSVFRLFTECFEIAGHKSKFGVFFVSDGLDHLTELFSFEVMSLLDVFALTIILVFDDLNITLELFMKTTETTLLEGDQVIDVDEMVSQSHLVLLFSFIEITIVHLDHSFLGVNLSVVVLLVDLDVFLKLLGLGETKNFTPVSQNLHSVEVSHLLLVLHLLLEMLALHLNSLELLVDIIKGCGLILDLDGVTLVFVGSHTTPLDVFT